MALVHFDRLRLATWFILMDWMHLVFLLHLVVLMNLVSGMNLMVHLIDCMTGDG